MSNENKLHDALKSLERADRLIDKQTGKYEESSEEDKLSLYFAVRNHKVGLDLLKGLIYHIIKNGSKRFEEGENVTSILESHKATLNRLIENNNQRIKDIRKSIYGTIH